MTRTGVAAGIAAGMLGATAAAAAGFRVRPQPFPEFPGLSSTATQVPLREGLPRPVDRWLRSVYGDHVPVISSVVVSGRARLRPFGYWLPGRFRFIHDAGRSYRHYIEATWYGRPFLRVNESYLDGRSEIDIPLLGRDGGPQLAQAANLGMWAELAAAAPAVLATHPGVRWRKADRHSAALQVPFGPAGRDEFEADFDPASGELRELRAWRYRDSSASPKVLWRARCEPGPRVPGTRLPAVGTATWADQGRPWAWFITETIRTNVAVADALQRRGL